jgi:hypothetical protein
MPQPLYPIGDNPWYPLKRRLGWPWNQSGHYEEQQEHAAHGIITAPTTLSQLLSST